MSCIVIWNYPVCWICFHPLWCILILFICDYGCGCGCFLIFPCCRFWGLQVARNFHPWRCDSIRKIDMFDLHPRLFCLLVGVFQCGVSCLDISASFLMCCSFLSPMDANGVVGDGFVIFYIKYSSTLVDDSLMDTPGVLLFLGKIPMSMKYFYLWFC